MIGILLTLLTALGATVIILRAWQIREQILRSRVRIRSDAPRAYRVSRE